MKKTFVLLILATASASMLVGCGTNTSNNNIKETTALSNMTPEEALIYKIQKNVGENVEVRQTGSVLYLESTVDTSSNSKSYFADIAKKQYNQIHEFLDDISSSVICVWLNRPYTDNYGNEKTMTAYRINVKVEDLNKINWDNYLSVDFEALAGDDFATFALK